MSLIQAKRDLHKIRKDLEQAYTKIKQDTSVYAATKVWTNHDKRFAILQTLIKSAIREIERAEKQGDLFEGWITEKEGKNEN